MSLMRLPSSLEAALRRLRANGIDIDGPQGSYEIEPEGVVLTGFRVTEDGDVESEAVITVRRNILLVSPNMEIMQAATAWPATLTPGTYGPVRFQGCGYASAADVADVVNLARLHVIPVA